MFLLFDGGSSGMKRDFNEVIGMTKCEIIFEQIQLLSCIFKKRLLPLQKRITI